MKTIAVVCLMLLVVATGQEMRTASGEESKIVALETAWNLAEVHKNGNAVGGLLADDFVYTEFDGTLMDKGQYLASFTNATYHPQQIASSEMKVHMYGSTAIVTGVYRDQGSNKGKA